MKEGQHCHTLVCLILLGHGNTGDWPTDTESVSVSMSAIVLSTVIGEPRRTLAEQKPAA